MKKFFSLLLALLLVCTSLTMFVGCEKYDDKLVIYNWDDYMYEDYEEDFQAYYKEKTGRTIEIVYATFDTNETMMTKVEKGDAEVDVICPSEYAIERLARAGLLCLLSDLTSVYGTFANIDNVSDIYAKINTSFASSDINVSDYMVPYMWGTLGILYNADEISAEQAQSAGWSLLWNDTNIEAINGKIYMKDSIRDSYAVALLYLKEKGQLPAGYDTLSIEQLINTVDATLIAAAEQALIEQKEVLYGYEVDLGKDDIIKGRALVGVAWSGDAMYSIEEADEHNVNLEYFVPQLGGNIWFDGWVIPTTAENKEQAKYFIEFLNQPYVAMENMMEIGYTSGLNKSVMLADNDALEVYYDAYDVADSDRTEALADFFDDARRYPDIGDVKLGVMHDFGDKNENVVKMWERVREHGLSVWGIVGIVLGGIVLLGAVVFIVFKLKDKKRQIVE